MQQFFSIDSILFTFLGYPMSYLEFFGTLFNLGSVILVAKNKIWNWPVGIVGIVLFSALFYQIHLYSDLLEQSYFLVTSFWGWWLWSQKAKLAKNDDSQTDITTLKAAQVIQWLIVTAVLTTGLWYVVSHIHIWLPDFFPTAAAYPFLDAFTTALSFVATILMAQKKVECWWLWILVDIIGIGLYAAVGVPFVSLLYVIFLVLAINGLRSWRKTYQAAQANSAIDA